MDISINKIDQIIKIAVDGRIDTNNYNQFENAVNGLFEEKEIKAIYLDCSKLNYISSSGLRIFLTVQKKMMSTNGKFILYAMQPAIKEIFDISGFSSIFSIYETEQNALQQ